MSSILKTKDEASALSQVGRRRSSSAPHSGEEVVGSHDAAADSLRALLSIFDVLQDDTLSGASASNNVIPHSAAADSPATAIVRSEAKRRVAEWRSELRCAAGESFNAGAGALDASAVCHSRPLSGGGGGGGSRTVMGAAPMASLWVHVLWDAESAELPAALRSRPRGPHALRDFLARRGVVQSGANVAGRFKLYFRPTVEAVCDPSLRDLDRAGFECVAALGRGADAIPRLISDEIDRLCSGMTEADRLRLLLSSVANEVSEWATAGDRGWDGTAAAVWGRADVGSSSSSSNNTPNRSDSLGGFVVDGSGGSGGGGGSADRAHSTIVLVTGGSVDYTSELAAARKRGFRVVMVLADGPEGDHRAQQYVVPAHIAFACMLSKK
jgi:hypothetical protein